MSTFDGRIRQYPTIYIDNYAAKQDTRIFLLSHCHADHLSGLKSPNFDVPLYCSKETAYLLLRLPHKRRATNAQEEQPKYLHLAKYLRPLEYEEPLQVYIGNGQTVTLTLFPANHCVGSTMYEQANMLE
ncbi:Protein artemis [Thoreauomyces humboldtii]|nr:Protein artemis [Thoreauomyces humboldtii]